MDKQIDGNARRPGLTRRSFAAGAIALGSATSMPLIGASHHAAAQAPKRGGKLTVAWGSTSLKDTMDPARTLTFLDLGRATQVYNRLIEIAPSIELRPALAEAWEANAANDEWTLRLRQGVTFHNGKPFTAQDAIYTIRRVLDPETASTARAQIADIDGDLLKADDAHTLRIKLKAPNPDLPRLLALFQLHIVPDGFTDFMHPIGTGPFVCKSFQPGESATFLRNPNYWRGGGLPYLEQIDTIAIQDPSARFNALVAGDIQAMVNLDANLLGRARAMSDIDVFSTQGTQYISYPMLSDAAPFNSNDLRLALKYAMDRQQLLDLVYAGQGTIGFDHPVPAFDPFHCPDIPLRPYDPERSKFHLKKSGQENTAFELFTSTEVPNGVEAATVYAEMANKAGINVKVTQAPADSYYYNIFMKKPWSVSSWWGRPTIDSLLSLIYTSSAPYNEGAWKNPKFDLLIEQARRLPDQEKRKQLYWDAQHMLADEGPTIIPTFMNWLDAKSPKMMGLESHPLGSLGWFFWEQVWLAD